MAKNYFEIFDLPVQFDVDLDALDDKYFELQRKVHPDMKTGNAIDSAELNLAYKALTNRFKKAEYLVELSGEKAADASPMLLMEMMELREGDVAANVAEAKVEIEKLFAKFAGDVSAETFVRIKYLQRFLEEQK